MATTIKGVLEAVKTDLEALTTSGSDKLFKLVRIGGVPSQLRSQRVVAPVAVISDLGGARLERQQHKYQDRALGVTIVTRSNNDPWGEKATLDLLEIGEQLTASMKTVSDIALHFNADSDAELQIDERHAALAIKTYRFDYELQRSDS